jgi:hypothetical protein
MCLHHRIHLQQTNKPGVQLENLDVLLQYFYRNNRNNSHCVTSSRNKVRNANTWQEFGVCLLVYKFHIWNFSRGFQLNISEVWLKLLNYLWFLLVQFNHYFQWCSANLSWFFSKSSPTHKKLCSYYFLLNECSSCKRRRNSKQNYQSLLFYCIDIWSYRSITTFAFFLLIILKNLLFLFIYILFTLNLWDVLSKFRTSPYL